MTQLETAKIHILNLILANTDSSVLLKLTESYETLVDAELSCPAGTCADNVKVGVPDPPVGYPEPICEVQFADWQAKDGMAMNSGEFGVLLGAPLTSASSDWMNVGRVSPSIQLDVHQGDTPAPFTKEPTKRKPRGSGKAAPAPETEAPSAEPTEPVEDYAIALEEAKALFLSKIQAANAKSDDIGKATRAQCVELCKEFGAARVSEVPANQLREFITLLEKI